MADTAYDRFLKDVQDDEAIEIEVKDPKPLDMDQVKLKIQEALTSSTEPKKPVKWLAMPDPKNILNLYYTLDPTKRITDTILTGKDPKAMIAEVPDAKAPVFKIGKKEITQERDYIAGLDEIATGINSGIYDLQNSIG